jgi:hypothetical protein
MAKKKLKPIVRVYNIKLTDLVFGDEGETKMIDEEIYDFNILEPKEYRNLVKWSYYDYISNTLEKDYAALHSTFQYEVLPTDHSLYNTYTK